MLTFNNYFLITLIANLSLYASVQANREEDIKAMTAEAVDRLEVLLKEIPIEKILELRIIQEKRQIIRALLENDKENKADQVIAGGTNTENSAQEAHCFVPKQPKALTEEENKKPALDRIKEKFIGDIHPEMLSAINYFDHREQQTSNNITVSNRVLLHGEPGTGKTHFFKVIAHELQIPSLYIPASLFADKFFGESSNRVRKAFEIAKKSKEPVLIFIDEIDAIGSSGKATTQDEQKSILMALFIELEEVAENKNVYIMVATNDFESLDHAVTDRFPSSCHIARLNREQRETYIMKLFKDNNLPLDIDLAKRLAEATEKYRCRYTPESEKHLHPDVQTKAWKDCSYSNRDLDYIVTAAKERKFTDCVMNQKDCTKKLCAYFGDVMSKMGKTGKDARGRCIINCDNPFA